MKLQLKLKKRIIKTFSRGTYDKPLGDKFAKTWFHAQQYNPNLIFPNIKNTKQK